MYASEITGEFIPEPPGSGLMLMNEAGSEHEMPPSERSLLFHAFPYFSTLFSSFQLSFDVFPTRFFSHSSSQVGETTMLNCSDPNTLLLQMGAFAQIYTGQDHWRPSDCWWNAD